MQARTILTAAVAAMGLLVTGAGAQHEQHHQDQAAPAADKGDSAKMAGMMSSRDEAGKLVDQLVKNFEAIEAETDPTALKTELAEHRAILLQLQTKVHDQAKMMEMMRHMMDGNMTGGVQE